MFEGQFFGIGPFYVSRCHIGLKVAKNNDMDNAYF